MPDGTEGPTAAAFLAALAERRSDAQLAAYPRYFPSSFATADEDPDDHFIGVRMGEVFALAKAFGSMPLDEIERLLESPIHEARAGAVRIMADQARDRRATDDDRQARYELYLRRHDRISDWDLVDLGAWHVVGRYLVDHPRDVLDRLAGSADRWERRTAVLATLAFVQRREIDDAFRLAERLADDRDEAVAKAVGWVLRAAGDIDPDRLMAFLDAHVATMPRSSLRAALEHVDADLRAGYLAAGRRRPT
jgi:3-methyladenine DNA glycosylase AlkD